MNADRDFERKAQAWLAEGPDRLPDRVLDAVVDEIHLTRQRHALGVPWREIRLNQMTRALAGIAVVAAVLAGGTLLLRPGPGPAPAVSPAPVPTLASPSTPFPSSTSPTRSPDGVSAGTKTFTSTRYGYSIDYPAGWAVRRASEPWGSGMSTNWGSPVVDELRGADVRLSAASQPLRAGETPSQRLQAMTDAYGTCDQRLPAPASVRVGTQSGTAAVNGCSTSAFDGGIAPGGHFYVVVLVVEDRAYTFILDGNVDPEYLQAILATVTFDPASAVDPSPSPSAS